MTRGACSSTGASSSISSRVIGPPTPPIGRYRCSASESSCQRRDDVASGSAEDGVNQTDTPEVHMLWWGLGIVRVVIWLCLAFWPARVAGRKGHSFLGYFVLSLFFFPLSLIMAYAVQDRTGNAVAA